jgi:hypothetical protein
MARLLTWDRGRVTNADIGANGGEAPCGGAVSGEERTMQSNKLAMSALGGALVLGAVGAAPARAADAQHPTVIELFQSQGCSSCPPANASLIQFSERPDVLALNFAVTYWDRLGWKDTFATPQYTQRQYDYSSALHGSGVYTPEIIVNGRADGVGDEVSEMEALARKTDRGTAGPSVAFEGGEVAVGAAAAPAHGADVWLALYDPRTVEVAIARGENAGRTLPHKNIVHRMILLGHWHGEAARFTLPAGESGLARAVLVQSAGTGPILAAAKG